jgi:predicted nucleic acid-binding protein
VNTLRGIKQIPDSFSQYNCYVSVITYFELFKGVLASKKRQQNILQLHDFFVENQITILPLTKETIDRFYIEFSKNKKQQRITNEFDLLIASTAVTHGYSLHTGNKKHFMSMPSLNLI